MPTAWVRGRFERFCRLAAAREGFALDRAVGFDCYERGGRERWREVYRLGVVRAAFRAPMETWLLCDLAAHLGDLGFAVNMGRFCPWTVTPRNVVIAAART